MTSSNADTCPANAFDKNARAIKKPVNLIATVCPEPQNSLRKTAQPNNPAAPTASLNLCPFFPVLSTLSNFKK